MASSLDPAIDSPSVHDKVFRASSIIGILSMIFVAATIAKELVIARQFGRSSDLDSFLIAFLVPSFLVQLFAEPFNAGLIPAFMEVRENEGEDIAQQMLSSSIFCNALLLGGTALLLALFAPYYLPLLATGFDAGKLALTRHLLYALLPLVVLRGFVFSWTSVLNAYHRFALPAISPLVTPLAVTAFLLLRTPGSVLRLALGLVMGSALEMGVLGWALHKTGLPVGIRWHGFDHRLRAVVAQYVPIAGGMLFFSGTNMVDQAMAAMLPAGSVAALNYASKPIGAVLFVGVIGISTVTLPYFSSLSARGDWAGCRKLLVQSSRYTLALSIPVALSIVFFSRPLIRLVFQRGAFTPDDTAEVAGIQSLLALQIPFYIVSIIATRLMNALKLNQVLMALAAISLLLNVVLNYIFMQFWGLRGIALATSLVYASNVMLLVIILLAVLRSRTGKEPDGPGAT